MIDFLEKTILVTGASSGIGRAICMELDRSRARCVCIGRNEKRLEETRSHLSDRRHIVARIDLGDYNSILPALEKLVETHGKAYGVCYCAGVDETRPFSACKPEMVKRIIDTNLLGAIEFARIASRRELMEATGGSILFISSIAAHVGIAGRVPYSASKGGMVAAARSMAAELARRKIRVNIISPGLVRTDMTKLTLSHLSAEQIKTIEDAHPLGLGTPEDVARAAAFLLAPQNAWITGADLIIDGGYTLL